MMISTNAITIDSTLVVSQQVINSTDNTVKYLGVPVDSFPMAKAIGSNSLPKLGDCLFVSKDTIKLSYYQSLREFVPGMEAKPLIRNACSSDLMVSIIMVFLLTTIFVLSHTHKFLYQRFHDFFFVHKPSRKFEFKTVTDARIVSVLVLQTAVFAAIAYFCYFIQVNRHFSINFPSYIILVSYVVACLLYVILKWALYSYLGWVFLNRQYTDLARESYFTLICITGFLLFPVVVLIVFSHLSAAGVLTASICILFSIKSLMFYKWIKVFSQKFLYLLLLILYFCALEIIPCYLFSQCIIQINNMLIKNF